MRIQNSLKNMFFGLTGQIISSIMGFIVRSVFIFTLGVEYLGVEGLFSSILVLLSLANLGFDTTMTYSLYKPLAENDRYKIQALMNLYKKAYNLIGLIVLFIGLSLLPFLPYLMNGETTIKHINIIYLLFLLQSVSSYYFAYKHSIIIADQHNHIISKIHSVFTITSNLMQIILLLSTKDFIAVLTIQIAFRIIENVYVAFKADKLYPYLRIKTTERLSKEDKKTFMENLYSQSLYKVSAVVITGTDNIVISVFIGMASVGKYSNYLLIIGTISTFISYLFHSVVASVGNLIVKENIDKKFSIFRILHFANFWIYGFCTVCLWCLINPFITLWLSNEYVFNKFIVFAVLLNFYTGGMQNAATTFRETTGLFKKGKYRPIIAVVINLVVSIILTKLIGVAGVLLGTVASRICTYFWYDPYVIFKNVFEKPVIAYFLRYILFGFLVFISAIITDVLGNLFHFSGILNLAVRGLLCLSIPNLIILMLFRKSDEFQFIKNIIRQLTKKYSFKLVPEKNYNAQPK